MYPIKRTKLTREQHRPNNIVEVWHLKKGLIGEENTSTRQARYKKSKLRGDWSKWK